MGAPRPPVGGLSRRRGRRWATWALGLAGFAVAVTYPLPFQSSGVIYFQTVGFLVLLYSALGIAWNIIGGWCGQFDFGPMVFFGVGAYTLGAAVKFLGLNPWAGLAVAALLTTLFAGLVTAPITRLRDHYFAIATNAIWLIAFPIATNWELIGGSRGLFIPLERHADLLGQLVALQPGGRIKELVFYYLVLAYFLLVLFLVSRLEHTKLGYSFKAVRDDEEGAAGTRHPRPRIQSGRSVLHGRHLRGRRRDLHDVGALGLSGSGL